MKDKSVIDSVEDCIAEREEIIKQLKATDGKVSQDLLNRIMQKNIHHFDAQD